MCNFFYQKSTEKNSNVYLFYIANMLRLVRNLDDDTKADYLADNPNLEGI